MSEHENGRTMRILVVQYAGDYRQAYNNVYEQKIETYHAQRYAMESLTRTGAEFGEAGFLCCRTSNRYNVVLPTGLRAMGAAADPHLEPDAIVEMISSYDPTHLVIHVPIPALIKWGIKQRVRTMALLAGYFPATGIRRRLRNWQMRRMLNDPVVEWVANHNIDACLSTRDIGVREDKIIPFDWPHLRSPKELEPKRLQRPGPIMIGYAGLVEDAKGVGDIVAAVAALKSSGVTAHARIAGSGSIDQFARLADEMGVPDEVEFLGLIPNHAIIQLMRESDVVVVPSHHRYHEGFPLTIYEAFCSRTPVIASDHPMFRKKLAHRTNALIYPAGQPKALAASIQEIMSDARLYATLSENSEEAWNQLQVPVKWGELIYRWVRHDAKDQAWLSQHSLAGASRV